MKYFDFDDYKHWINTLIRSGPRGGHGQYRALAAALDTSSAVMSQVFKGSRDLNLEQAHKLCKHLQFSKAETEYLLLLVQKERAGTRELKNWFGSKLHEIQLAARELKNRLPQDQVLSEEAKATFYSHWYYSGVRLLSSIEPFQTIESITNYFGLSREKTHQIVDFLLRHGLCVEEKGKIKMGPQRTHLGADSPLIARHHGNWRLQAMQKMERRSEDDLFYSAPMSLSREAAKQIRKSLAEAIEQHRAMAFDSREEQLVCVNVDFFEIK